MKQVQLKGLGVYFISLLVFGVVLTQSTSHAKEIKKFKRDIILILNLFEKGETGVLGNQDTYLSQEVAYFEKRFPDSEVITFQPENQIDMKNGLDGMFGAVDKGIRILSVHSHGTSMIFKKANSQEREYVVIAGNNGRFNKANQIDIHLNQSQYQSPYGIDYFWSGIIGKFLPGAQIVFDSCSLLAVVPEDQRKNVMGSFLDLMDVKSADLYFNATIGSSNFENIAYQTFQSQQTRDRKFNVFFSQLFSPLTYLPSWYNDHYINNQGLQLHRAANGDSTSLTDYYSFFRTMSKRAFQDNLSQ